MSKEVVNITESQSLVSQELNNQVLAVLSNKVEGFEKAFVMASAIQVLKERLTPEFMKPIMALQGSNLGFKTDKNIETLSKEERKLADIRIYEVLHKHDDKAIGFDVSEYQSEIDWEQTYLLDESFEL